MLRYGNHGARDRESSAKLWRKQDAHSTKLFIALALSVTLSACESAVIRSLPTITARSEEGGLVVADEPQAVLITRGILNRGGSAADGAVALGFALSVTLQSAAGIGGGGLCTVFDATQQRVEVLDFVPQAAVGRQTSARWQTAVPTLARGLFALHAKYGKLPWQQLVVPAENLARFGSPISRAFARDIREASDALVNDPNALDFFMSSRRTLLQEGDRLTQLDLAATFGRIRGRTPGDFYAGALAKTIDESALTAGVSINADDLRRFSPTWRSAQMLQSGPMTFHVGAYGLTQTEVTDVFSSDRGSDPPIEPSGPAATGYVVADAEGNAVACSLTMVEPFGAGLVLEGLGFLMAPNPEMSSGPKAQLISIMQMDRRSGQVNFIGAAGGAGAAPAIAHVVKRALIDGVPLADGFPPAPQRSDEAGAISRRAQVNAANCRNGLDDELDACSVGNDPLGLGYGLIAFGDS